MRISSFLPAATHDRVVRFQSSSTSVASTASTPKEQNILKTRRSKFLKRFRWPIAKRNLHLAAFCLQQAHNRKTTPAIEAALPAMVAQIALKQLNPVERSALPPSKILVKHLGLTGTIALEMGLKSNKPEALVMSLLKEDGRKTGLLRINLSEHSPQWIATHPLNITEQTGELVVNLPPKALQRLMYEIASKALPQASYIPFSNRRTRVIRWLAKYCPF